MDKEVPAEELGYVFPLVDYPRAERVPLEERLNYNLPGKNTETDNLLGRGYRQNKQYCQMVSRCEYWTGRLGACSNPEKITDGYGHKLCFCAVRTKAEKPVIDEEESDDYLER